MRVIEACGVIICVVAGAIITWPLWAPIWLQAWVYTLFP